MPGAIQCRGVAAGRVCRIKNDGYSTARGETKHAKKCCPDLVRARGGVHVKRIAPALGK